AQWYYDVARLERARRRLREQRGEEHRVLRVDDRRAALAEGARDVAAGVPAAHGTGAAPCLPLAHGSTIATWRGFRSRSSGAAPSTRPPPSRWGACSPSPGPPSSRAGSGR